MASRDTHLGRHRALFVDVEVVASHAGREEIDSLLNVESPRLYLDPRAH